MKRTFLLLSLWSLTCLPLFSCGQQKSSAENSTTDLTANEQKVVDYFVKIRFSLQNLLRKPYPF